MKDLGNFIDSTGKIKTWPSKIDMKLEVLKYLSDKFEYNHFYREKEINIIIESNHTFGDYFLLRRGLIENNLLTRTRDGSRYWRPDSNINEQKMIISKVLEINYDIGLIINIIKIKNGVGSSCFHILTGKGEFIFKNVEDNGMNHPSNEAKIHEILESENIPVSKFCSTKSGEYVLNFNGNICNLQSI